jgi:AAA domain
MAARMSTYPKEEIETIVRRASRDRRKANGVQPRTETYTAADLQWMEFPPLQFTVPGYLAEGLTLLVGKPKRGKSWMALDWVLAIAHGGFAFGWI